MGRKLRYIPDGGALVEVTCRTLHGRLLLRPSPELNDIAAGVLGRAQRLYPVELVAFQSLSNHYHALLFVKSAKRLAEFAGYFNSNLAREVARLTGWTGKIWERRYQAIPISGEEEAQVARLKYVSSHGVKENLVARLREWPGLHCVRQIVDGESLAGTWYDRTQEHAARRRRGEDPDPLQYTATETVTFSPLPCWSHLSTEEYRERIGALAMEIEEEAAAARKRTGAHPFGAAKILAQHPWTRPERVKKSPAPLLHAASKAVRQIFYEGFALFVAAYRTAAEKLKRGDPSPGFPCGSFPPALPFVGGLARLAGLGQKSRDVERLGGGGGERCVRRGDLAANSGNRDRVSVPPDEPERLLKSRSRGLDNGIWPSAGCRGGFGEVRVI